MNLENILPAVIAIFGVIVGSVSTYFSQSLLLKKQIKRDQEKEKELKLVETMDIYSKFLDVKGNVPVLQKIDSSTLEIDLDKYEKHIRPILMEKIYLIHDDVSQIIMNINRQIEVSNYNEEITKREEEWIVSQYLQLEDLIIKHLHDYRNK